MTFASYIRRELIVRMRKFLARHVGLSLLRATFTWKPVKNRNKTRTIYTSFSCVRGHARINGTDRVLLKTRLIFPRTNSPNVLSRESRQVAYKNTAMYTHSKHFTSIHWRTATHTTTNDQGYTFIDVCYKAVAELPLDFMVRQKVFFKSPTLCGKV